MKISPGHFYTVLFLGILRISAGFYDDTIARKDLESEMRKLFMPFTGLIQMAHLK